jgi:hypothetical protein
MNADRLREGALLDEAFEAEFIAYSRLSRDTVRRESASSDANEVPTLSFSGDEADVLCMARVMIELYGTGAANHASHRAKLKEDTADSISASIWRRIALTIEEMVRAVNDPSCDSLPLLLYSAELP